MSANTTDQASSAPRRPDDFLRSNSASGMAPNRCAGAAPAAGSATPRRLGLARRHSQITTCTCSGSSRSSSLSTSPRRNARPPNARSSPSARSAPASASAASAIDAPGVVRQPPDRHRLHPLARDVDDRGVEHVERVVGRPGARREEQPRHLVDEDDVDRGVPCPARAAGRLAAQVWFRPAQRDQRRRRIRRRAAPPPLRASPPRSPAGPAAAARSAEAARR